MAVLDLAPTTPPGFSIRAEVLARYNSGSDLDVSEIGYCAAFAYWKPASSRVYSLVMSSERAPATRSARGVPREICRLFEMAAESLDTVE